MMLATVGRGGDGQAIRDEILHIMHRNHIPELKGTWMEEWHQKLHNNTTPDDVPICKAYLAFLRSNGDNGTYWRVLSDAGLTRARLESFDRPIRQVCAWAFCLFLELQAELQAELGALERNADACKRNQRHTPINSTLIGVAVINFVFLV